MERKPQFEQCDAVLTKHGWSYDFANEYFVDGRGIPVSIEVVLAAMPPETLRVDLLWIEIVKRERQLAPLREKIPLPPIPSNCPNCGATAVAMIFPGDPPERLPPQLQARADAGQLVVDPRGGRGNAWTCLECKCFWGHCHDAWP